MNRLVSKNRSNLCCCQLSKLHLIFSYLHLDLNLLCIGGLAHVDSAYVGRDVASRRIYVFLVFLSDARFVSNY